MEEKFLNKTVVVKYFIFIFSWLQQFLTERGLRDEITTNEQKNLKINALIQSEVKFFKFPYTSSNLLRIIMGETRLDSARQVADSLQVIGCFF
jgi:hypothetical protein